MWHNQQAAFVDALNDPMAGVPDAIAGTSSRFDVYRNNSAVSLRQALAEAFPVVKALVGDDFFAALAQAYVRDNRPGSPVMLHYGQEFPAFVDRFEPARSVPYLADVARLERAWLDAYHAADAAPINIDALGDVREADLDDICLRLHPSLHLLRSKWPVVSIWQAHQGTQSPDLSGLKWAAECALVVRPVLDVHVGAVPLDVYPLMRSLVDGEPLARACAHADDARDCDPSAQLATFFSAGCVSGLYQHGKTGGDETS